MDKNLEKLKEQIAIEGFINASQVFSRDPLDFKDADKDNIDDRAEHPDEVDEI
jgi:hypothetical protein